MQKAGGYVLRYQNVTIVNIATTLHRECGGAVVRVVSLILTGSPHQRPWASCLPKVGLGSLSRK